MSAVGDARKRAAEWGAVAGQPAPDRILPGAARTVGEIKAAVDALRPTSDNTAAYRLGYAAALRDLTERLEIS